MCSEGSASGLQTDSMTHRLNHASRLSDSDILFVDTLVSLAMQCSVSHSRRDSQVMRKRRLPDIVVELWRSWRRQYLVNLSRRGDYSSVAMRSRAGTRPRTPDASELHFHLGSTTAVDKPTRLRVGLATRPHNWVPASLPASVTVTTHSDLGPLHMIDASTPHALYRKHRLLPRDVYALRGLCRGKMSVRLSHAGILSKRLYISSKFFFTVG